MLTRLRDLPSHERLPRCVLACARTPTRNTWAGMGMLRGKIAGQQTPIAFCDTCETHTPLPASFRTQRQYLPEPLELSLIIVREPARTLML